jgi:F0F1-type ATP synthase membrane subunit b/b'
MFWSSSLFPHSRKILGARTKGIEETFQEIDRDTQEAASGWRGSRRARQPGPGVQATPPGGLLTSQATRRAAAGRAGAQVQAAAEKSMREIAIERDKAVLELRQEATNLTLQAADHLVQSAMTDALQEKLVTKYLSELDGVKKT